MVFKLYNNTILMTCGYNKKNKKIHIQKTYSVITKLGYIYIYIYIYLRITRWKYL